MRAFERQPGETRQAYAAFCTYRDLGDVRSMDRAYCVHNGHEEGSKRAPGRWKTWSVRWDWRERAQAFDDYLEMERRNAVAEHERRNGRDLAYRAAQVQDRLLGVKELLVERMEEMVEWPLEKRTTTSEDGKEITHIHPARWSFHTLIKAIEILDDSPDKVSFTDPSGQHEFGQDPGDVRRMFLEILNEVDEEENQ